MIQRDTLAGVIPCAPSTSGSGDRCGRGRVRTPQVPFRSQRGPRRDTAIDIARTSVCASLLTSRR